MKFSDMISPLGNIIDTIKFGFVPTFKDVVKRPTLLFRPVTLSHTFFAHVWVTFGEYIDEGLKEYKIELGGKAKGVVLDIGAGKAILSLGV